MYRSFPNKKIFERSIKNVWKQKGWIFISIDFLMEARSDILLAKKTLLDTMKQVSTQEKFSQAISQKTFLKKFGHTEETLRPQVFLEMRPQGVLLR
jgi:Mechanosensitive ion channel